MQPMKRTDLFKRGLKRPSKGQHRATLDADTVAILSAMTEYEEVPSSSANFARKESGKWEWSNGTTR